MALATTCPQCKTSFKVIPDQLKLRRGLVRCGVCQHVFSGIDYLRYVDDSGKARQKAAGASASAGSSSAVGPPAAARARQGSAERGSGTPATRLAPAAQQAAAPTEGPASPQTVIASDDELKTAFFLSDSTFGPYSQTRQQDVVPPTSIVTRDDDEHVLGAPDHADDARSAAAREARIGPPTRLANGPRPSSRRSLADAEPFPEPPASRRHRKRTSLLAGSDEDDPDVAAANLLARQARDAHRDGSGSGARRSSRGHSSRWQGYDRHGPDDSFAAFFADPRRRNIVIGLVVLALLQLSLLFRNEIASRVPALRPTLGVFAGAFGMSVDAVRSLSSLSIESFELQASGRDDHLSLNAVLRNKDGHAVRWPAMELTLTDQASAVVVRKVILPTDYLNRTASRDGLNGRSEWPIRISLDPGGIQLAGYSVALFYP